jgi:hypothetical protein
MNSSSNNINDSSNTSHAMSRNGLVLAFALGLVAVIWVGVGFVGTSWIALVMTVAITAFYLLGALEIRRYRALTSTLADALANVPQPLTHLGDWLARVPATLQNTVRQRIEGERAALPGLALTPYLIGLLVMLGMLGTFLGMVVTFKGAVFALEGSADLQAIRSALAAPIKGLGLAFGTSVAGVATSAMLGLMSAISRRERLGVVRQLDARIGTDFRPFSLAHQRQETFKAMQLQAGALPEVANQLKALMEQIDRRSQQLDEQLMARQEQFHREAASAYTCLGQSVAHSLQDSLVASARIAGESIQPVVESAMAALAQESTRQHERVSEVVQTQLQGLSSQFSATTGTVADTWTQALQTHASTSDQLVMGLEKSLNGFASSFEQRASSLLDKVNTAMTQSHAERTRSEQAQQAAWAQSLQAMATTLQSEWSQANAQAAARQQAVVQALEQSASAIEQRASEQSSRTSEDMARLLSASEELVRARTESEARWTQQHGERMDQLATVWRNELSALRSEESARGQAAVERLGEWQTGLSIQLQALRNEEDHRGQAAVERLGELQAAMASHLATLGTALEAPMTRLMATASEAPKAAAEVIAQLRQEMSQLTERDNVALQERTALVENIGALLQSVQHTTGEQRAAIETLVASASGVLNQVSQQFAETLGAQAGRTDEAAAQVGASAAELASLGEAFQHGVQLFSATNEKLVDNLQRIEGAIQQSMARSDEQLAYYVAQAREVIDLSISSQQGIVEDLRRLRSNPPAAQTAKGTA